MMLQSRCTYISSSASGQIVQSMSSVVSFDFAGITVLFYQFGDQIIPSTFPKSEIKMSHQDFLYKK